VAALSERVQVLLSPAQTQRLKAIARREGRSVGSLIREAVEERYFRQDEEQRLAAVRRMAAMSLPVGDWQEMERESERWESGG
jgi:hypothetical protein